MYFLGLCWEWGHMADMYHGVSEQAEVICSSVQTEEGRRNMKTQYHLSSDFLVS